MGAFRRFLSWIGIGSRADAEADDAAIVMPSRGPYAGAAYDRLLWDWIVGIMSADREVYGSLSQLRARARDLARNNSSVAGYLNDLGTQVVGAEGFEFQAQILNAQEEPWRAVNFALEDAFAEFSEPENFTVEGVLSRPEVERLVLRTWATDGEVFIRERPGYPNRFGYALELIDADLVDETYNVAPNDDGVEIRMGVEVDRDGRRLAYHVLPRHPADINFSRVRPERIRVPASEIIHLFTPLRPGQTRGVSWFAPILFDIRMEQGYREAEVVAARMQAAKGGVIINKTPEAIEAYVERLRHLSEDEFLREIRSRPVHFLPGVAPELVPGQEFQQFDPTHPPTAFEAFLRALHRAQARALGVSYATYTGDLKQANFGSLRAGLLPERDFYRTLQQSMRVRLHRRAYRGWLRSALLTRSIALPAGAPRIPGAYMRVEFRGRGWPWIDPLKDIAASDLEIKLGVNSRQRVAAERGRDYEEIVDELAEEQRYAQEAGVYVGGKSQPATREGAAGTGAGRSPDARSRIAHLTNGNGKP